MTTAHETKIKPFHLTLLAVIYVRQSTFFQVQHNTASAARQYDLRQLALDLGWSPEQIVVIDQDQARSAATVEGREGFKWILNEIYEGRVGALFCLDSSRLNRDGCDFLRLIKACADSGTLIIDENGIHDPTNDSDHLLLSILGIIAEADLRGIRAKLLKARLRKAEAGELRIRLPIGLVRDQSGEVRLDPDEEVRSAVELIFTQFDHLSSALAVVRYFRQHGLLFPTRDRERGSGVTWAPLKHTRVVDILQNPAFAGAYVWGRTKPRPRKRGGDGSGKKKQPGHVKREEWLVVRHGAYPAYITWEGFLRNQQRLDDNRTVGRGERKGAIRAGAGLLQGLMWCGPCDRRMHVQYSGLQKHPYYRCTYDWRMFGGDGCQTVSGPVMDEVITQLFLRAISPAQLELSVSALEEVDKRGRAVERQHDREYERARYEARRAEVRYKAVDAENRLVARTLEREWNEKMLEVERLERERARRPNCSLQAMTAEERGAILALAQDIPAIWGAETTSHVQRKQLLRLLIKKITLLRDGATVHTDVLWQTGATTHLDVSLPPRATWNRTDPGVIERIRVLSRGHSDDVIAERLNEAGLKTAVGGSFTRNVILHLRRRYNIRKIGDKYRALAIEQLGGGRVNVGAAAAQ